MPDGVVNNRFDWMGQTSGAVHCDFVTPEYSTVGDAGRKWESTRGIGTSFGYNRFEPDESYLGPDELVRLFVDVVAHGGNLLLNVGPTGRGDFDPRATDALRGIGEWMRLHSRSIYGAGASSFTPPPDARYTQRGDRLYLHLFTWPLEDVNLPGLAGKVEYAQMLNDASELSFKEIDPNVLPHLPERRVEHEPDGGGRHCHEESPP